MGVCPSTHEHGLSCHTHHRCRCEHCTRARWEYDQGRRYIAGAGVLVPSEPTTRRLRALACHGWSVPAITEAMGASATIIRELRVGCRPRVRSSTAKAVADFYAKQELVILDTMVAQRSRSLARRNGWHSPLEWDDIELGILG